MADPHLRDHPLQADHASLYELLISQLRDFAVFLTDEKGRVASWHPGVEHLLGYAENEWLAHRIHDIFTPEDQAQGVPEREIARACRDGQAPDVRWHQRKDGTRLYVEGTLVALRDSDGKVMGLAKVIRDITERKKAEDGLRRSELRQSLLLQLMSEQRETTAPEQIMRRTCEALGQHLKADRAGFFEKSKDDRLVLKGGWTAGTLPLPVSEMPARHPESKTSFLAPNSVLDGTETVAWIVAPVVRKGNWEATLYVEQAEPRVWTEDEISLAGEVADLTWDAVQRVRAEEAKRVSDERLTLALEAAEAVGTWDWDLGNDLIYAGGRFAELFSIDPAQAAAGVASAQFFEAIHPEDRGPVREQIQQAIAAGGPASMEYRVLRNNGSERWVHALGHAYRDEHAKPSRFPGTLIDITERKEMERALRRSEEFNRGVLESTRDCIVVLDPEARILAMNRSGQQELGIEDFDHLANRRWLDFWEKPAERAAAETAVERTNRGQTGQFEGYFPTMRGEPRWWDVRVTPILDAEGRPERLLAVARDVTERKIAEDELRRARDEARTILESITDGFYALNRDWTVIYFNSAAEQITGFRRDDLLGQPHWHVFAPLLGPRAEDEYGRAVRDQVSVEFETWCEPLQQWLAFRLYPTQDGGLSVYFRDITRIRQKDEELRRQYRMFDAMLAQTPDHTNIFDPEGRWIYANAALLRLLQQPLEELAGKRCSDVLPSPELASRMQHEISEVITTRQPIRNETPYLGADGATRFFEYILSPIFDADGQVQAVSSFARDITERRQNEELERQRQEQFRESARLESLGIMAGGIAHDFNNLLVGVLGNASLLEECLPENERPIAREIILAAETAADLTRQMLAYSGKGRFVVEVLDLNNLMRENLTLLRASLSRNVSFALDLGCDDCFVEADRSQMQQIAMNLLLNASEAVGERAGEVRIRTARVQRASPHFNPYLHETVPAGDYVLLEVSDDGSGIRPETMKKIFDPFFTTKFTGRGLGLAAVLGIVKGHRGDIEVESHPGRGTTFRVYLPAHGRSDVSRARKTATVNGDQTGKVILVVDDEAVVRRVAISALESRGLQVIEAVNGLEALEKLQLNPRIAVVILDLTMPVMTGEQALPLIRQIAPGVPVVLSSGFSQAEVQRRFESAGIVGVLQKPYTAAGIVQAVMNALNTAPVTD